MIDSIDKDSIHNNGFDEAEELGITHTIFVPDGKTLESKVIDKAPPGFKPRFLMVGSGNIETKKGQQSMNYTNELLDMSKPAGYLFRKAMDNRLIPNINEPYILSNISIFSSKDLTNTEKRYIKLGYKELRAKNILVREKRGLYIINPRMVVSSNDWQQDEIRYKEAVANHK